MVITDAKRLVGSTCEIWWRDRGGDLVRTVSKIHDATFVPLYGGYLITDTEDVRLDRITSIEVMGEHDGAGEPGREPERMPVAA